MSPWLARRWYDVVFWSSFIGFTFGNSIRIMGRYNMPESGPVLVLANHQSFFDPLLVGLASRRYLCFLARNSLFKNRYLKALIESLDAIPIDNKGLGKNGLQATLQLLKRGKAVLVFPEGERTQDGQMEPFKAGITLLIKHMQAPIVPVGIAGAFGSWSRFRKFPRLSPLFLPPNDATMALSIGRPIASTSLMDLSREELQAKLFDLVAVEFNKANRLRRKKRGI